jgi:hypothetical protein
MKTMPLEANQCRYFLSPPHQLQHSMVVRTCEVEIIPEFYSFVLRALKVTQLLSKKVL